MMLDGMPTAFVVDERRSNLIHYELIMIHYELVVDERRSDYHVINMITT